MKRNVRRSKYDPLVDEVDLIEANPQYAHVRLQNGRETTVSIRQLAPPGERRDVGNSTGQTGFSSNNDIQEPISNNNLHVTPDIGNSPDLQSNASETPGTNYSESIVTNFVRRSTRPRKVPDRLGIDSVETVDS